MVDADVVAAKLRELEGRLSQVRSHARPDGAALAADQDALELVSFNLMLAVQACLDIASHLIADEGWIPAVSLGESFQRLGEHDVVTSSTAAAMQRAVGLRNVVAYGYANLNVHLLHTAAGAGVDDLEHFAREIAAWMVKRA